MSHYKHIPEVETAVTSHHYDGVGILSALVNELNMFDPALTEDYIPIVAQMHEDLASTRRAMADSTGVVMEQKIHAVALMHVPIVVQQLNELAPDGIVFGLDCVGAWGWRWAVGHEPDTDIFCKHCQRKCASVQLTVSSDGWVMHTQCGRIVMFLNDAERIGTPLSQVAPQYINQRPAPDHTPQPAPPADGQPVNGVYRCSQGHRAVHMSGTSVTLSARKGRAICPVCRQPTTLIYPFNSQE